MTDAEIELRLLIKRLRRVSLAESLAIILGFTAVLFAVMILFTRKELWYVSLGLVLLTALAAWLTLRAVRRYKADQRQRDLFRFPIRPEKLSALLNGADAFYAEENSVCFLIERRRMRVRELVQVFSEFDRAQQKQEQDRVNKKVNRLLGETGRMESGVKYMRVQCVVCDAQSEALVRWLVSDFARLLTRGEIIVRAAVVRDRSELLFPIVQEPVYPFVIDLYQTAFLLLKQQLME